MRLFSALALLAATAIPATAFAASIDLSTGTSWNVSGPAGQGSAVASRNPAWTTGPSCTGCDNTYASYFPTAQWIVPPGGTGSSNYPIGTYVYLSPSFTAADSETVYGSFASDNQATVYLFDTTGGSLSTNYFQNGPDTSYADFQGKPTDFSFGNLITGHIYELEVQVTNGSGGDNPTGLLLQGTAATPEPSSLALLGTGILGVAGAVRRRFSSR